MKALVYTGTQELVYRDEPNPIEVSGESILKIHASGICGSDMHAYHGHDERRVPPLILGFIFSASTIWNTNLMFLQSYAWIIGAFVAWITYYLLAKR